MLWELGDLTSADLFFKLFIRKKKTLFQESVELLSRASKGNHCRFCGLKDVEEKKKQF
jgi:hypothetical protein